MICWSCQEAIPDTAERCPHCEAEVELEPTEDEKTAVQSALSSMVPKVIRELHDAFEESATGEEFVNRIMIGDCPTCGSSDTGDCEHDPEIDDPCVARCLACGQLWCPDCGELFKDDRFADHDCPAWEEMDLGDDDSDQAD
jgi:hypothetical protein